MEEIKFIDKYKDKLIGKKIPLIIYYSKNYDSNKNLEMIINKNQNFNNQIKNYQTKQYFYLNKFYKPISRVFYDIEQLSE